MVTPNQTGRTGMTASDERARWLIPLAAMVSHFTPLWAGYIWLDHAHIEEGLALAAPVGWLALFTRGFAGTGYYRPLMSLSLSIDAALGGGAFLHHAVTVLWHAVAAFLCVEAARSLGVSRRAAFWAGLLFAVHPATSLVANAIAFRSESMITAALLALVIFQGRAKAWSCAGALLLGALTKETALVLGPLFVVALELFPAARQDRTLSTRLRFWAPSALAFGTALGLRLAFAPAFRATFPQLTGNEAVGTRLSALAQSALTVLSPMPGPICDVFPVTPPSAPRALLGLFFACGLGCLAYLRRGPAVLLVLSTLPSLQLVPVMRWWSPHYVYLPLAFAAMLIAEGVERWAEPVLRQAAPVVTALGLLSLFESRRYETDEKLWQPEVSAAPTCREGHFYLGASAHEGRRLEEAGAHYERALVETPGVLSYVDRDAALQNLGVVRLEQARFEEARSLFRSALELAPEPATRRKLTHNLATAELGAGRPAEAAALLRGEVERSDALPASLWLRARALGALGQKDEARALLRRLPPDFR